MFTIEQVIADAPADASPWAVTPLDFLPIPAPLSAALKLATTTQAAPVIQDDVSTIFAQVGRAGDADIAPWAASIAAGTDTIADLSAQVGLTRLQVENDFRRAGRDPANEDVAGWTNSIAAGRDTLFGLEGALGLNTLSTLSPAQLRIQAPKESMPTIQTVPLSANVFAAGSDATFPSLGTMTPEQKHKLVLVAVAIAAAYWLWN